MAQVTRQGVPVDDVTGRVQWVAAPPVADASGYPVDANGALACEMDPASWKWDGGVPISTAAVPGALAITAAPAIVPRAHGQLRGAGGGPLLIEQADPVKTEGGWPVTATGALAFA